jgi:hypothetical protein
VQGPPIAPGVPNWDEAAAAIAVIGREMTRAGFEYVASTSTATTDGDGIAVMGVYQVAAGIEAWMPRLTMNALNPSTGAAYTPASSYSSSSAYAMLFSADAPIASGIGDGSLLDFAPLTANTRLFPWVFQANDDESAPFVRGPSWFVLKFAGGPASTTLFARYQVKLRRMGGVA